MAHECDRSAGVEGLIVADFIRDELRHLPVTAISPEMIQEQKIPAGGPVDGPNGRADSTVEEAAGCAEIQKAEAVDSREDNDKPMFEPIRRGVIGKATRDKLSQWGNQKGECTKRPPQPGSRLGLLSPVRHTGVHGELSLRG